MSFLKLSHPQMNIVLDIDHVIDGLGLQYVLGSYIVNYYLEKLNIKNNQMNSKIQFQIFLPIGRFAVYFFKYTPTAITPRGTTCLDEQFNANLLEMRYSATIDFPPSIYDLKYK